jgi:hypothetical protein
MQDVKVFEKQAKPDFSKSAGGGFASSIPICFRWKANRDHKDAGRLRAE